MALSVVARRCGRVAACASPWSPDRIPDTRFRRIALCRRFLAAGDSPTLLTGTEWLATARAAGVDAVELVGLDPTELDDDADAGAKIHQRAARMAVLNVPVLRELAPDLVVSDVITACGGLAAELLGIPWIELNPQPLYRPSKGLPPLGSGLAPGVGIRGRLRDAVMRALTARSWRDGHPAARRRSGSRSVCPQPIPGRCAGSSPRCPRWRCRARTGRTRPSSSARCTSSRPTRCWRSRRAPAR